ncbi:transposase [Sporosalibacterium faouarense]|uniref:transposase n=1 Tax=Sporosalibacterium faouarense TaxID=516123 RepID=UPI00192B3E43|nr:transposase [Sporosalibacterium faouarense]
MRINKHTPQNYININKDYQLVLPINSEVLIPQDDSVRLLSQVLEGLKYDKLMQAYLHLGRKPVVSPKNLFKVLVYSYMNNIYSSREIEKTCKMKKRCLNNDF